MRKRFLRLSVVVLVTALAACSGSKSASPAPYGTGDPALAAPGPYGSASDPFLTDGNAVLAALHDIQSHYPTPIRLTSISAHVVQGLIVDVIVSTDRARVVRYIVAPNGKTLGPIPVNLLVAGKPATPADVALLSFAPSSLALANLTPAVRDAIARSKIAGARISQWGLGGANKDVYVVLDGPNQQRILFLDHQLHFLRFYG